MHSPDCRWPLGSPCRTYSTEGTALGAVIAHTMGTTSEEEITRRYDVLERFVSDIEAEQADWESDESNN
jgi:hypothetical protein